MDPKYVRVALIYQSPAFYEMVHSADVAVPKSHVWKLRSTTKWKIE
jgi:hypothetical protein